MTANKAEIDLSSVVCKDCTPVFYEPGEVPHAKPGALILKWVVLCQRHAAFTKLLEACKLALADLEAEMVWGSLRDRLVYVIKQAEGQS